MIEHSHCQELLSSLSDYVDGDLNPELCAELERHLQGCERCRVVVDTLKKTVELYQETSAEVAVPTAVRERLFARLNLDDFCK